MKKELIEDIKTTVNLYRFNYYDVNKTMLLSTSYKDEVYGFDKVGRQNFYAKDDYNVSLVYSEFNKALESLVYKNGKSSEYKYTYTNDAAHKVKTITSPEGLIEIFYDEYNNIKEMTIDRYHMKYEHNQNGQPTKITSVGKGEIITSYDDKGEIENIKYVPIKEGVASHSIAQDITRAMSSLLERASKGNIKKYPYWLW